MLLNFCHPCLRPEVTCSTVSTEGYEVKNLVSESSAGFLAYACIKPPINIDLTFLCNVQISRVIIWPVVGSQKSSGFQLLAKSSADSGAPYATLSTAYLNSDEPGVIFYRRDLNETLTSAPDNFLQRYIKISDLRSVNGASNLRLRIVKTDNSVPALGKIEVWGRVSRCCGRDVTAGVNALWIQEHSPRISLAEKILESPPPPLSPVNENNDLLEQSKYGLEIPEDFLDPITYEIMVQPIVLPSGKIVDQFTLERHERNEATWGRLPSDPFTGIQFSKSSRPVTATALKVRIDKFLIENSNADEVKDLPRILGRKRALVHARSTFNSAENIFKNDNSRSNLTISKFSNRTPKRRNSLDLTKGQHKLPIQVALGKESMELVECKRSKFKEIRKFSFVDNNLEIEDDYPINVGTEIDRDLELNVKSVLSGLKRFGTQETCKVTEDSNGCSCCETGILYKLPCTHIVCRKVLTSVKILQCQYCSAPYKTSDPKRIHE